MGVVVVVVVVVVGGGGGDIQTDAPDWLPIIVAVAVCWSKKRNNQHWSHAIFDDETMVSLEQSGRRAFEFHLFLGCNNPLSFQQHDEKLGHDN